MLIYFDTRGSGRSEAPKKNSGYAFGLFLDDFETLRLHLHLDHWLIFAHSAASSQAMAYAIKYPKACRGLFIVDGTPNIDGKEYEHDLAARMKKLSHEPWFAAAKKASDADPKSDKEFRDEIHQRCAPTVFCERRRRPESAAFCPNPRIMSKRSSTTTMSPNSLPIGWR